MRSLPSFVRARALAALSCAALLSVVAACAGPERPNDPGAGVRAVAAGPASQADVARGGGSDQGARASAPDAKVMPVSAETEGVARLASDVRWLADDAQQGRRAGTADGRRAGRWIAERLMSLGLQPAGDGSVEGVPFAQAFDVPLPARDGGGSTLEMGAHVFRGAGELAPLFCSDGSSARGPLVWCGYGVVHEALGWDDYAFARKTGALRGGVALIVRGTPPVAAAPRQPPEPDPSAAGNVAQGDPWENSGSLFAKVMAARRLGARAVLVAPNPAQAQAEVSPFDAARSAQASIPCLMISLDVARALEPAFDALVAATDAGGGPRAFRGASAPVVGVQADVVREKGAAWNVLGLISGRDPSRTIVVGAHYDHLGLGGEGSLAPAALGQVHNGADDNASGTAVVLELARQLAAAPQPQCNLVFALWSGEEEGLLGSEHWAKHPTVPLARVAANLNLDMVGRAGNGALQVLGVGTAAPFYTIVLEAARAAGLEPILSPSGQGVGGSDHQTFLKRRIPALHLFSGVHADYHKPSDDSERFEADGAWKVARFSLAVLRDVSTRAGDLAYVEPPAPQESEQGPAARGNASWRVWFGSVPDYAYQGEGLMLSGTSAGSPAEHAGLLAGDVLTQVGDIEVKNIYDFMSALQAYKPGNVVRTKFLRDGEPHEVMVSLRARDAQ